MNRFQEQCVKCACHIDNAEGEVKAQMDEVGIECSLEQPTYATVLCQFFQESED